MKPQTGRHSNRVAGQPRRSVPDVARVGEKLYDYLAGYRRQFRALCSHDPFFTAAIEML
ncbi:MAG TPA: hypothetical protein VGL41_08630 [Roseiarcus sp.]